MTRANTKPVAICCRADAEFRRAHVWAIGARRPSILVPRSEWGQLARLQQIVGEFDVLTDEPTNPHLDAYQPIATRALCAADKFPVSQSWPTPVATLLTSGSTGAPKVITKAAAMIVGEGEILR